MSSFFNINNISTETFISILPNFFCEVNSDFSCLSTEVDLGNYTSSTAIAHKIKGVSHIYGVASIVSIVNKLEEHLRIGDSKKISKQLNLLKQEIVKAEDTANAEFSIEPK